MRFVLDASVAVIWVLRDEAHPLADRALLALQSGSTTVPAIWWYEIRNVLILNERRGRITRSDSDEFIADLKQFDIDIDFPQESAMTLNLARKHTLSVYDAAYLALAMREGLPLATRDKALAAAAAAEGIPSLD